MNIDVILFDEELLIKGLIISVDFKIASLVGSMAKLCVCGFLIFFRPI